MHIPTNPTNSSSDLSQKIWGPVWFSLVHFSTDLFIYYFSSGLQTGSSTNQAAPANNKMIWIHLSARW